MLLDAKKVTTCKDRHQYSNLAKIDNQNIMNKVLTIGMVGMLVVSCSPIKKSLVEKTEQPVYEIAVREVKEGQFEDFKLRRADFISWLKVQDGVQADREFESFYAMPQNGGQTFVGMTQYTSYKYPGKIQSKMGALKRFPKFAKTMDIKSYVFVQPIEGPAFDLKTLAKGEGEVLEIAIRKVKPGMEDEFNKYRKEFVALLGSQNGVKESYEFKVVGGKDVEGLTVGMTVYKDQATMMGLMQTLMGQEIAQKYMSTFDMVTGQYVVNTTNQ